MNMKLTISKKIVIVAAAGVIASSIIVLILGSTLMSRLFNRALYDDMYAMQALVENMLDEEEARLLQTVNIISTLPEIIDVTYERNHDKVHDLVMTIKNQYDFDLVLITDNQGIVMSRAHSDQYNDDISDRTIMQIALDGGVIAGVYYNADAVVPLSLRSIAPIYKDGNIVGVLNIGTNISSEAYVDHIKRMTNMDFTIFYGTMRFMTSFVDEYGNRIIGTEHADSYAASRVLNNGEIVIQRGETQGDPNMFALWPMIEPCSGDIVGMFGIAMSVADQVYGMSNVLTIITFCSFGVIIFIVLIAGILGNKIAKPIGKATEYAVQVSEGKLDTHLDVHSHDEVGLLVGALDKMVFTLKKKIAEVEAARESAELANKAKSSFLSVMSHEIRTPMNAIIGIAEILSQNEELDPKVQVAIDNIYSAGNLLLRIINDILDLSKIEAGKLELHTSKYEVASLVSDTVSVNSMRIGSKEVEFELNIDEHLPATLFGDQQRIKQILNNLLSNAFKYTDTGKVELEITFEQQNEEDDNITLIIVVTDTGQGMTTEQVGKLFDEYARFNQEANRATEGTGLGMNITQNLIRLMDGTIAVDSVPGVGSTFTVHLPQVKIGYEELGREISENLKFHKINEIKQSQKSHIKHEPMPYGKVLIVDDVETNIYIAKGLLAPYELNIDSAKSGFEAIDKINAGNEYDVVFMDHMMPKMDGVETTKRIREMGYDRPICALTANAVAGQADMFLNNGFDDFISKPIDMRQMNRVLNEMVRDKHNNRSNDQTNQRGNNTNTPTNKNPTSSSIKSLSSAKVDGLDIKKGLARYGVNEETYLTILNAYATNMRQLLTTIENVDDENLLDYRITVHGIKGASLDVFAATVSEEAKALEEAALNEDIDYIHERNSAFRRNTLQFLDKLDDMLANYNIK